MPKGCTKFPHCTFDTSDEMTVAFVEKQKYLIIVHPEQRYVKMDPPVIIRNYEMPFVKQGRVVA